MTAVANSYAHLHVPVILVKGTYCSRSPLATINVVDCNRIVLDEKNQ